jgi:mycofactocin system glycosyltransferase
MTKKFVPDVQWFRSRDGLGVLAGSPLSFFRVSPAGARVLDAIENRTPLPEQHEQLTDRLIRAGAIHPVPSHLPLTSDITVVIPAFITDESQVAQLQGLVDSLTGLGVVVVDDCSPIEVVITGATIVRHRSNLGPGAARNTGLERVTTPFVAFVDDDTEVTIDHIVQLTAYLEDSPTVMVAPRVLTRNTNTAISEYESHHSPLDLGTKPAIVRPLSRVSYVPAAVFVARTEIMHEIGGFLPTMRLGEDVDLVWRLAKTDGIIRYVPHIECAHLPRPSVRAVLRQRFGYGSSAAHLDALHPYTASPLRTHALFFTVAVLVLSGYLLFAALILPVVLLYFMFILHNTSLSLRQRVRVIFVGLFAAIRLTASAVMRAWWPIFFLLGAYFIRPGFTLVVSAFAPVMIGLARHTPSHPLRYSMLRVLDPIAYGAGVWAGAFRRRSLRCLLPVITVRRSSAR